MKHQENLYNELIRSLKEDQKEWKFYEDFIGQYAVNAEWPIKLRWSDTSSVKIYEPFDMKINNIFIRAKLWQAVKECRAFYLLNLKNGKS